MCQNCAAFNSGKDFVQQGVQISPQGKSITPVGKRGGTPAGKRK